MLLSFSKYVLRLKKKCFRIHSCRCMYCRVVVILVLLVIVRCLIRALCAHPVVGHLNYSQCVAIMN